MAVVVVVAPPVGVAWPLAAAVIGVLVALVHVASVAFVLLLLLLLLFFFVLFVLFLFLGVGAGQGEMVHTWYCKDQTRPVRGVGAAERLDPEHDHQAKDKNI